MQCGNTDQNWFMDPLSDGFVFTNGMAKAPEMFTLQYIYVIDVLLAFT